MIAKLIAFATTISDRRTLILLAAIGVVASPLLASVGAEAEFITNAVDPDTLKVGGLVASTGMLGLLYYLYKKENAERLERQRKYDKDDEDREKRRQIETDKAQELHAKLNKEMADSNRQVAEAIAALKEAVHGFDRQLNHRYNQYERDDK